MDTLALAHPQALYTTINIDDLDLLQRKEGEYGRDYACTWQETYTCILL